MSQPNTARLVRSRFSDPATFAGLSRVPVEIFGPGRFDMWDGPTEYTHERITAMVAKTKQNGRTYESLRLLPLKVNHDDDADAVVGWIDPEELTVSETGTVIAYPTFTEPAALDKLARGTYRYVSVEIYLPEYKDETTGDPLGEALRDVAIVPHPRHRTIRGFVFAEGLPELSPEPEPGEPAEPPADAADPEPDPEPAQPTDPPTEGNQRGEDMFEAFSARLRELLGREPTPEDLTKALEPFEAAHKDTDTFADLPPAVAEHFRAELEKRDQTIQALQAATERERRAAFLDRLKARIDRATAGPEPEMTPHQGNLLYAIASAGPGAEVRFEDKALDWTDALFALAKLPDGLRALLGESGSVASGANQSLMDMGRQAGEAAKARYRQEVK